MGCLALGNEEVLNDYLPGRSVGIAGTEPHSRGSEATGEKS